MFRQFTAWIDSWSDSFPPTAVRDLRRLKLGTLTCGILLLAVAGFVVALNLTSFRLSQNIFFSRGLPLFLVALQFYATSIVSMVLTLGWERNRWGGSSIEMGAVQDETFRLTPLTAKDYIKGLVVAFIILEFYLACTILPILVASQLIGSIQFWPFALIFNGDLLLLLFIYYCFSYEGIVKTRFGSDILSVFTSVFFLVSFIPPWFAVFHFGFNYLHWPMLEWDRGPIALALWIAIPGTSLLLCFLCHWLLLYHFAKRQKTFFRNILLNFVACFVVNGFCAAGFFGLCVLLY